MRDLIRRKIIDALVEPSIERMILPCLSVATEMPLSMNTSNASPLTMPAKIGTFETAPP
jgi:hypothetical protein